MSIKLDKGLTLVEVLIASSIILGAVLALLGAHNLYLKVALSNASSVKAAYLAEEGIENMRHNRNVSWTTNIFPLTTETYIENFLREVTLSEVYRDASGNIISSGGTLDPDTVLVTSNVSWMRSGATTTKSVATYLVNIYDN